MENDESFNPRPYQVEALNALWSSMQIETSQLLVAATGAGKTFIFSKIIQRLIRENICKRILVLVDREVLVTQTYEKICKFAPELSNDIGFCCDSVSKKKELDKKITIASRQTLVSNFIGF